MPVRFYDKALYEYLKDNIWIKHFQYAYRKHLENKENWIDFESEISEVVQAADKLYHAYMDVNVKKSLK